MTTRRLDLVMGRLRQGSAGPRREHGTTWRKRPRGIDRIGRFEGTLEQVGRSRCNLGQRIHVGMLRPMRLERWRDQDPVALADDPQSFGERPPLADLTETLGPGERDPALRAGHGAKRVEPTPIVAAQIEEGCQSCLAVDFENEHAGIWSGNESPVRPRTRPAPQLLQIVRSCLEGIRMRHRELFAGGYGEELPALSHCGTINLDRNPMDVEGLISGHTANSFNRARTLLECVDEQMGWLHSDLTLSETEKPVALSP